MRYDPEHKERTRQRLLAEAAKAVRALGPGRVAIADVMARAGLTHGGFYAHFKSREALIAAAIGQAVEEAQDAVLRRTRDLPPREALHAYFDWYLSEVHRDRVEGGCPMPSISGEVSRLDRDARDALKTGVVAVRQQVGALLRQMGAAEPDGLAASLLSEAVGAMMLARAMPARAEGDALLDASRRAIRARIDAAARA